jgi:hypothetical protein
MEFRTKFAPTVSSSAGVPDFHHWRLQETTNALMPMAVGNISFFTENIAFL